VTCAFTIHTPRNQHCSLYGGWQCTVNCWWKWRSLHERGAYSFLHARGSVGGGHGRGEAELVHHPVSLGALAGASAVVHEGLLEPDGLAGVGCRVDRPIDARRLPEPGPSDTVGSDAVPVLPSSHAEEVPFLLATNCARLWKLSVYNFSY
jgi:hypothetical protein